MYQSKTIGKYQIELSTFSDRVSVQYKTSEIIARAWKGFCLESNNEGEYNRIQTEEDVKKFFASAHNYYVELI